MVGVWGRIGTMLGPILRSNVTLLRLMSGAYSNLRRSACVLHLLAVGLTEHLRWSVEGG
jgi:hypothetical protein